MARPRRDLTGQTFGRLVALSFAGVNALGRATWLTRCSCGTEKVVAGTNLTQGGTKSCGCLNREVSARMCGAISRTHGMNHTASRKLWTAMWDRCRNPNSNRYRYYGARGIAVCERWAKFENFYADMGERPPGMSLDRIDSDGPYSPENCRWATDIEQAQNRRNNYLIEHNGETQCLAEWARRYGVDPATIKRRFKAGEPLAQQPKRFPK